MTEIYQPYFCVVQAQFRLQLPVCPLPFPRTGGSERVSDASCVAGTFLLELFLNTVFKE